MTSAAGPRHRHEVLNFNILCSVCNIQVEASCERLCQALGGEVHRLALQVQVLEQSDTLAIEAEAVSPASCTNSSIAFACTAGVLVFTQYTSCMPWAWHA